MSRSPGRFNRRRLPRRHSLTRSDRRHDSSGYYDVRSREDDRRHVDSSHKSGTTQRSGGASGRRLRSRTPPPATRSRRHGDGTRYIESRSVSSSSSGVWRDSREAASAARRRTAHRATRGPPDESSSSRAVEGGAKGKQSSTGKGQLSRRRRRSSTSVSSVDSDILVKGTRDDTEKGRLREQKVIDDEVNRRVEMEVQKRVEEMVKSDAFQKQLQDYMKMERARAEVEMKSNLDREKRQILEEFRRQERESQQKSQQLEDILAENERKIRDQQVKLAKEQASRDEERLLELQRRQQQVDFEVRRRKVKGSTGGAGGGDAAEAQLVGDVNSVLDSSALAKSSPDSSRGDDDSSPSKVKMAFKFHKGAARLFE